MTAVHYRYVAMTPLVNGNPLVKRMFLTQTPEGVRADRFVASITKLDDDAQKFVAVMLRELGARMKNGAVMTGAHLDAIEAAQKAVPHRPDLSDICRRVLGG